MNSNTPRTITTIKNKVIPLLNKYKVSRAGLFGSTARGDYHTDSDIDILVSFPIDSGVSLMEVAGLKLDLEEVLGSQVDLVQYEAIRSELKDQILHYEIRIL